VYSGIPDRNVNLRVAPIADEALGSSVEERLRVLWLGARSEDFLVIEDNGAVCRGKIIALLSLVAGVFILACLVLVDLLQFQPSNLVNLDREDPGGIFWHRR
jgi:hypothetical protein